MKRISLRPRVHLNLMAENKFKTNYICMEFRMPLAEKTASLYALIPKVLERGCEAYPDMTALTRRAEELYGTGVYAYTNKNGEGQNIAIASYPLANEYAMDGMDILSETLSLMEQLFFFPRLENGLFLTEYVESEKRNLADSIRAEINNKSRYALSRAQSETCRGEAFAVPSTGTLAQVEAITPQSLTEAYHEMLKKAKVEIWAIGKFDETALADQLKAIFARLPEGEAVPADTEVKRKAEGEVKNVDEVQPAKQARLVLSFRTGRILADGDDYTAFVVFLALYGSGTTSRLFMNVREKLSLCYDCSAFADALKGLMFVQAGIDKNNREIAQKEILAQLKAVQDGDFTSEELENAKICLINRYREIGDEAGSIKAWFLGRLLAGRCDSPEQCADAVRKVTAEQVIAASRGITLDTVYFLHGEGEEEETEEVEA